MPIASASYGPVDGLGVFIHGRNDAHTCVMGFQRLALSLALRPPDVRRCRGLEDIIDPFYGEHVPRQQGGLWRHSFRDLERQHSRLAMRMPPRSCVKTLIYDSVLHAFLTTAAQRMARGRGRGCCCCCSLYLPRDFQPSHHQALRDALLVKSTGDEEVGNDGRQPRLFFGELTERHFKHSELLTLDELDDRMQSISVIATRCVLRVLSLR